MITGSGGSQAMPIDTPYMGTRYCPGCDPERDPLDGITEVTWCSTHSPDPAGESDRLVSVWAHLSGGGECGGEDNARWCNALHRGCSDID